MERVTTLHLEPPNDRQKLFFQCRKKYIAFVGARGGGKSWAVRTKAKLMALGYPGIRLLLVRRSYQELESNHIRFLRRELRKHIGFIGSSSLFSKREKLEALLLMLGLYRGMRTIYYIAKGKA